MELNMAVFINAINALISKALDETITTAEVNMIKAKLKMMDDTDAFDYREIAKFKKHIASFVKIIKLREINKAAETVVASIAEPIAEPIAEAIAETVTIAEPIAEPIAEVFAQTITVAEPVITEQIPEVIAETIAVIAEPVTTEQIPEVIAQPIIAVTRPLTRRTLKILPKVADSIPKIIPVKEPESDSDAEIIPKIDLAELKRRSGITAIRTSVLPPSEYDDDYDSDEEEQTKEQEKVTISFKKKDAISLGQKAEEMEKERRRNKANNVMPNVMPMPMPTIEPIIDSDDNNSDDDYEILEDRGEHDEDISKAIQNTRAEEQHIIHKIIPVEKRKEDIYEMGISTKIMHNLVGKSMAHVARKTLVSKGEKRREFQRAKCYL